MTRSLEQCIYCTNPVGSREHVVLSAIGGLREDRGILCGKCNSELGYSVDEALARDLATLCAQAGVLRGRDKTAIEVTVTEPSSGRDYTLSEGGRLQHPEVHVIRDQTSDAIRSVDFVASTVQQRDEFIRKLKAEGKPYKVNKVPNEIPLLVIAPPVMQTKFGDTDTLRGVAKAALNVLAHLQPSRAREPWLDGIKRFIVEGGPSEPWVWFDYLEPPEPRIPSESFALQHRFLIGADATSGRVYARVSFFGVYELAVHLGTTPIQESVTLVYDVDPLATKMPDDFQDHEIKGVALGIPGQPTLNPAEPCQGRLVKFLKTCCDLQWQRDEDELVAAINGVRELPHEMQRDQIGALMKGQLQRLLNLVTVAIARLKRFNLSEFEELCPDFRNSLTELVVADANSWTGISSQTMALLETMRKATVEAVLEATVEHPINGHELRRLLERDVGLALAFRIVMSEVEVRHPELATPTALRLCEND
jgi:hypothetical protein